MVNSVLVVAVVTLSDGGRRAENAPSRAVSISPSDTLPLPLYRAL